MGILHCYGQCHVCGGWAYMACGRREQASTVTCNVNRDMHLPIADAEVVCAVEPCPQPWAGDAGGGAESPGAALDAVRARKGWA